LVHSIAIGIILSVSRETEAKEEGGAIETLKIIVSGGGTGGHIFPPLLLPML